MIYCENLRYTVQLYILMQTKQVKNAASDESSVFHDIAEKRFELRFPGAVHKQTNKTNQ